MKRKWERDLGLQGRMIFTMFLLAAVYIFFLVFLSYNGTPPVVMVALLDTLLALSAEEVVVSDVLLLVHPDIATTDISSKPITKKLIFFIIVPQKYCLIVTPI